MPNLNLILPALGAVFFFLAPCCAEKLVTPPQKIYYDDRRLTYNPAWQEKEIYKEADLDGDGTKEIVIGFIASYKPVKDPMEDEKNQSLGITAASSERDIPVVSNYVFYQIYDKKPNGYYELAKTINGMDRLGRIDIVELGPNNPPLFFILSPGGEHYLDLCVYQWRNGGYQLLFNKGSSDGLELDLKEKPFRVRIAKVNEEKKTSWDIFVWDSEKNNFRKQKNV
jgi:hypothetical protein